MKLSTALSVFALTSLFGIGASGQGTPDCQWTETFTSATAGASRANTSAGNAPCVAFRVTYQAEGMTALSIQIEGAPDVSGAPGAWVIIPSTAIVQGTNPLTGATSGTLVVDGAVYYPWMRMNVTVFTPTGPTGSITDRVYGYKGTSASLSGGSIPIGPCGGDLSGSFPNCTVIGTNGLLLPVSAHVLGTNGLGQIVSSTTIPAADGNTSVQYNSGGLLAGDSTQFAWFETSIGTPTAPVVTQHGAAGAVTYSYQIAWLTLAGNGPGGAITTTTTGNAVLSAINYNIITPPACPATASGYIVERTTDPNSNLGSLPIIGVCGSPINDVYGATYGMLNQYPTGNAPVTLNDTSQGLYALQVTSPIGQFGDNPFSLSYGINGAAVAPTSLSAWSHGLAAVQIVDENNSYSIGISGMAIADQGSTGAVGMYFPIVYTGSSPMAGTLTGAYVNLTIEGAGSAPGWNAGYQFGEEDQLNGGTGQFQNVAAFDVENDSLGVYPLTGVGAVLHNAQVPVVGQTLYFLLEEGGLPSKLGGTLTITPLKSITGQVFVCANTAGLLVRSATACVGTI